MTFLKIILITVGVAFTTFGYKMYFQKKYTLINGFVEAWLRIKLNNPGKYGIFSCVW